MNNRFQQSIGLHRKNSDANFYLQLLRPKKLESRSVLLGKNHQHSSPSTVFPCLFISENKHQRSSTRKNVVKNEKTPTIKLGAHRTGVSLLCTLCEHVIFAIFVLPLSGEVVFLFSISRPSNVSHYEPYV